MTTITSALNAAPYFDDFSSAKNFQQILFKPGQAVQARELTQLQSILRNQVAKFGSHIFKEGSVVLPGNTKADLDIKYVTVVDSNNDLNLILGKTIIGTSGLKAFIKSATAKTATDPVTLFVSYYNTASNGQTSFAVDEVITIEGETTEFTAVSTGNSALAYVNNGVFFVRGSFVEVATHSTVIAKYTNVPHCRVLLKITETIVNANIDTTLLDPAQGSYNYAAPGADRYKIELTLTTLPLEAVVTDDYIELMRYNNGVLEEHLKYARYNELEKNLARRTYDESGDYVAAGLLTEVFEHNKTSYNNGKFVNGNPDSLAVTVAPGKAYIKGFEVETLAPTTLTIDKGRTAGHVKTAKVSVSPSFGQYILITNLKSLPSFINRNVLTVYNAISTTGGKSSIGTVTAIGIDLYEENSSPQTNIYKLYVTNVSSSLNVNAMGSVGYGLFTADIAHKFVVPVTGVAFSGSDIINGTSPTTCTFLKYNPTNSELFVTKHSTSSLPIIGMRVTGVPSGATGIISSAVHIITNELSSAVIELTTTATKSVKTGASDPIPDIIDINYKVFAEVSIPLNGFGVGSVSANGYTFDPVDNGTVVIVNNTAVQSSTIASVDGPGTTLSISGGPVGTTIKVVCSATKTASTGAMHKTKTYKTIIETGVTPANVITLTKADGIVLQSVVSSVNGDVTSRYKFSGGQTDYVYNMSTLTLIDATVTGTLSVTYTYFQHDGLGDYFSIDSYVLSGLTNYYDSLYSYVSPATGKTYNLRNCLDFRPIISGNMIVQPNSRITTSAQFYVPRIDYVSMSPSGTVSVTAGLPAVNPVKPNVGTENIPLALIYIPSYTFNIKDVKVDLAKNSGYTMSDIHVLEDRVKALEDYSMLTQSEGTVVNNDIIDAATGLSRYKSGYLVESFTDAGIIADFSNPEFAVTYNLGYIMPLKEHVVVPLQLVSNTGTTTGGITTINYTKKVFASQTVSTGITNVNPFAVFSWQGSLELMPKIDNFEDVFYLPQIFKDESTFVEVRRPWNWQPTAGDLVSFAANPRVFVWGVNIDIQHQQVWSNDNMMML